MFFLKFFCSNVLQFNYLGRCISEECFSGSLYCSHVCLFVKHYVKTRNTVVCQYTEKQSEGDNINITYIVMTMSPDIVFYFDLSNNLTLSSM